MRIRFAVVAAAALALGACGYTLAGRGGSLPAHILRIGVPMFQNESTTADIDRIITEAVRRELNSKGKYIVVADSTGVDAVLTGTIRPIVVDVPSFTDQRQVSAYRITLSVSAEFRDIKESKALCCTGDIRVVEQYDVRGSTGVNDPLAQFGQDASARERVAKIFAQTLVTRLLENF